MGQQLVRSGYDQLRWTDISQRYNGEFFFHREFQLHEFNVLISAIESFMEKVWSSLKA